MTREPDTAQEVDKYWGHSSITSIQIIVYQHNKLSFLGS